MWNTNDDLVGRRVLIYTADGEEKHAVVTAVSTQIAVIKVRAVDDGTIFVGNQWDDT